MKKKQCSLPPGRRWSCAHRTQPKWTHCLELTASLTCIHVIYLIFGVVLNLVCRLLWSGFFCVCIWLALWLLSSRMPTIKCPMPDAYNNNLYGWWRSVGGAANCRCACTMWMRFIILCPARCTQPNTRRTHTRNLPHVSRVRHIQPIYPQRFAHSINSV